MLLTVDYRLDVKVQVFDVSVTEAIIILFVSVLSTGWNLLERCWVHSKPSLTANSPKRLEIMNVDRFFFRGRLGGGTVKLLRMVERMAWMRP